MPAKIVIERDAQNSSLEAAEEHLRSVYRKHLKAARELVVQRRNRGPGSGDLETRLELVRDDGESDDDLVDDVVKKAMRIIAGDANLPRGRNTPGAGQVRAWQGDIVLFDSATKPKKELARVPVSIEDPNAFQSYEVEGIAVLNSTRQLVDGLRKIIVDLGTTFVKREKAQIKMIKAVAKSNTRLGKSAGKWKYKAEKRAAKAQERESEATRRAQQTRARMEAFSDVATEYKDVFAVWSEYVIRAKERKPGEPVPQPPQPPTLAELKSMFAGDDLERNVAVRVDGVDAMHNAYAVASMMRAEPAFDRRVALGKVLVAVFMTLGPAVQATFARQCVDVLGHSRAMELKAWFTVPLVWSPPA